LIAQRSTPHAVALAVAPELAALPVLPSSHRATPPWWEQVPE